MPRRLKNRTLRIRVVNVDRVFAGPAEVVIRTVAELLSGQPVVDVSGFVDTLAEALDRDVAYEIEVGGTDPAPQVERIVGRLLAAGLKERQE